VRATKLSLRSFTFLVAVDFTHPDFLRTFNHRRQTFPSIAATAFHCFLQALEYIGDQKHLSEIASQNESYTEFLRVTQPVSDDMAATRREERIAKQRQQRKDRKSNQELGSASMQSLVAYKKTSLRLAKPRDYASELKNLGQNIQRARSGPSHRLLSILAPPSANSSTDTFATAVEEATCGTTDASTIVDSGLSPGCPVSDTSRLEDHGPETMSTYSFDVLRPKVLQSPTPSRSISMPNTLVNLSSNPTVLKCKESSQASGPSRSDKVSSRILDQVGRKEPPMTTAFLDVANVPRSTSASFSVHKSHLVDTRTSKAFEAQDQHDVPVRSASVPMNLNKGSGEKQEVLQSHTAVPKTPSARKEDHLALATSRGLPETLAEDESPQQLSDMISRISLPSDTLRIVPEELSSVSVLHALNRTHHRPAIRPSSSKAPSGRTTPAKLRNPELHLLRYGSPNVQPLLTPALPNSLIPSAAYERFTQSASRGWLKSKFLNEDLVFSYARPNVMTNCWLPTCQQPTKSRNIRTTTCPRCGPYSYVRYCSIQHLHADVRRHYIEDCRRRPNHLPYIDEHTISPASKPALRFLECVSTMHDSFERHRQALYHSFPPDAKSDYYIFGDADDLILSKLSDKTVTSAMLAKCRGTGPIVATIGLDVTDGRKEQFTSVLERLLILGCAAGTMDEAACGMLFLFVKGDLKDQGIWDEAMTDRLCLAMQLELGWRVPSRYF